MKEEDRDLKQLFDAFRPETGDSADFMEQLERRLDAIEYVRQMQLREQKRNRYAMFGAFGGGLAVGGLLYALLTAPGDAVPSITLDTHFLLMRIISENSRLFACAILGIIAVTGIIVTVGMCQDIADIKDSIFRRSGKEKQICCNKESNM